MLVAIRCRDNVQIEEDYQLAEWELGGLFTSHYEQMPEEGEWARFKDALYGDECPPLASVFGCASAKYYWCEEPRVSLRKLFYRLTYAQQVAVYSSSDESGEIDRVAQDLSWASRVYALNHGQILYLIPLFCILELAEVVLAGRNPVPTERIQDTVDALLATGKAVLHSVDYAKKRTSTYLAHGAHVYKAKFFPRVVRTVVNGLLPETEGKILLDPFMGSGTAHLEGSLLGMHSLGVDVDPLCVVMARDKINIARSKDNMLLCNVDFILDALMHDAGRQLPLGSRAFQASLLEVPQFLLRRLPREFADELIQQVSYIMHLIQSYEGPEQTRSMLRLALSDALSRKVRFRFHGLGSGRFALELRKTPLTNLYCSQLRAIVRSADAYAFLRSRVKFPDEVSSLALAGNAVSLPVADNAVDMVITSPPYIPASSGRENYAKTRALSFAALEMATEQEVEKLSRTLIGSMQRGSVGRRQELPQGVENLVQWLSQDQYRSLKAEPTRAYFLELSHALGEIRRVLRPSGYCAFVVARANTFYTYKTREITQLFNNEEAVRELGEECRLSVSSVLHTRLHKLNPVARPRSRDEYFESIIIFQKPGN